MKRLLSIVVFIVFLPLLGMAQSDFDGTWKVDLTKSTMPDKADVLLLQNGTYQCKTCVPPINVKADGEDHGISGNPHYDAVAVKVLDDHSVETTEKRNGKVVSTSKVVVSADGNTATFEFTDSTKSTPEPVVGKGIMTRVAKTKRPPNGAHVISGSWRTSKMETLSDNALTFTLKVDGDNLNMANPMGQSYTAKLDGTDAPYKGDPGINSVSILRLGKGTFMETDKRDSKTITTKRFMVTPSDGKTMTVIVSDGLTGGATVLAAVKQ
jgi:polyisoprenoid-binding protein YceI